MTCEARVAVVFEENASQVLSELVGRCVVWLVDSQENQEAVQACLRIGPPGTAEWSSKINTFTRPAAAAEEALDVVLELVEDHHGAFASESPVEEVLVIGLSPSEDVFDVLRAWGYVEIDDGPAGLLCRRGGCFRAES